MSTINPASALGAYKAASQTGAMGGSGGILDQSADKGGVSFGDVLKGAAEKVVEAQKVNEKVSASAVIGKADLTDVIQAANNAEMSLNLFVALRDKMIDAYNTISRMQV